MGQKSKLSTEEKLELVSRYKAGEGSMREIGAGYGVSAEYVRECERLYKTFGEEGLECKSANKKYSDEHKIKAVEAYQRGEGSKYQICITYKIPSPKMLRRWIVWYNNGCISKRKHGARGITHMSKELKPIKHSALRL